MSDSSSSIKEMLADYEKVKKELEELKKSQQQSVEKNLVEESTEKTEKDSKQKKVSTCPICYEIPEVPVWWNGVNNGKFESCATSQATPSCLHCVRQQLYHAQESGKFKMKCWGGCHIIDLRTRPNHEFYGEIGRDPNGPPCPGMYRWCDSNNVGCKTCSACGKECEGVYDLAMHKKNECSARKIRCEICKERMTTKEFEEHQKTCYRFCKICGPDGPKIEYKRVNGKMCFTSHECPNKTLGKCRFCQSSITFNNMNKHKKCSIATKSDFTTTCALNKEKERIKREEERREQEQELELRQAQRNREFSAHRYREFSEGVALRRGDRAYLQNYSYAD